MARKSQRNYSNQFKEKVLREYYASNKLSNTAREYNIPVSTLGTWIKEDKEARESLPTVEVQEQEVRDNSKDIVVNSGLSVADFDIIIAKREAELQTLKEARRILLEELNSLDN